MRCIPILLLAALAANPAIAAPVPGAVHQLPLAGARPAPTLAYQYEVKMVVGERRNISAELMAAGVDSRDAASVATLAGKSFDALTDGCSARLALTRAPGDEQARLDRITLYAGTRQIVIERRGSELALVSDRVVEPNRTIA